jgi:hypothetical protein
MSQQRGAIQSGSRWEAERLQSTLFKKLKAAFAEAAEEVFVDGMESAFSRRLRAIIRTHGDAAVHATERVMQLEGTSAEVASEAIRQIGSIVDPESHQSRLAVLLRCLGSPDPRLRDAASIGIAALGDPAAIEDVRKAIMRERVSSQ